MDPQSPAGNEPSAKLPPNPQPSPQSAFTPPLQDIEESAFGFEDESPQRAEPITRPRPQPTPEAPPVHSQPITPQQLNAPQSMLQPAPQPNIQPAPAPPMPIPADIVPPPAPPTIPSPQPAQPQPTTPAIAAAPEPSYQPPLKHVAPELVARINQTPMQNSSDVQDKLHHHKAASRLRSFLSFAGFAVGILVAAFLINQFVFQSYYVEGTSMIPTLQNDDRLIIEKVGRTAANIQGKHYVPARGQIIVFTSSIMGANGQPEQLIKRVIGLPGDTVIVKDGQVTIKNKESPQGFNPDQQLGLSLQPTYSDGTLEVEVTEGQVFVMGDNRVQFGSLDSRSFGPVDTIKIEGQLWARIIPLDKAGLF